MRLKLGISTCPNDTYIYEALVQGLENSPFEWDVHFADVQTLNEMVRRGELDVAKVSAQVYPKIEAEYACLGCGGAIGYGCGPLLLSSVGNAFCPEKPVVLPGADTTAALLFKFWHKKTGQSEHSLRSKEAVQGVVIHEHRFTWKRDGLYLLQDLGAFWEENTGTPIPLGIAVAKKTLGVNTIFQIEDEIRKSLNIARKRENLVTPFIDKLAQIDDPNVMEAHIRMFVNDFSEEVGERGRASLRYLWTLVKG